jgi:hypothetical protein
MTELEVPPADAQHMITAPRPHDNGSGRCSGIPHRTDGRDPTPLDTSMLPALPISIAWYRQVFLLQDELWVEWGLAVTATSDKQCCWPSGEYFQLRLSRSLA